jgi:rod shape-determining protein MreC
LRRSRYTFKSQSFPLQRWLAWAGIAMLIIAALSLTILERLKNPLILQVRPFLSDMLIPIQELAARPSQWFNNATARAHDFMHVIDENDALKAENKRLLGWQQRVHLLETENNHLRTLLTLEPLPHLQYKAARIINNVTSSLSYSLFLRLSPHHAFANNMAVMTERGLVGRLQDVSLMSARVLLVTDPNSRIPVITEKTRLHAMLIGNGTPTPELHYLPDNTQPQKNERVITSSDGGVFPEGIAVGIIESVGTTPKVALYSSPHMLEYVLIAMTKEP